MSNVRINLVEARLTAICKEIRIWAGVAEYFSANFTTVLCLTMGAALSCSAYEGLVLPRGEYAVTCIPICMATIIQCTRSIGTDRRTSHLFVPSDKLMLREIRVSLHLMNCWAYFAIGEQVLGFFFAEIWSLLKKTLAPGRRSTMQLIVDILLIPMFLHFPVLVNACLGERHVSLNAKLLASLRLTFHRCPSCCIGNVKHLDPVYLRIHRARIVHQVEIDIV